MVSNSQKINITHVGESVGANDGFPVGDRVGLLVVGEGAAFMATTMMRQKTIATIISPIRCKRNKENQNKLKLDLKNKLVDEGNHVI